MISFLFFNQYSATPFHYAVQFGRLAIVQMLTSRGINIYALMQVSQSLVSPFTCLSLKIYLYCGHKMKSLQEGT